MTPVFSQSQPDKERYSSLNLHLHHLFGEKVYKVTLNGGMTCPNRDGHVGTGGCIFCSAMGSGDFAGNAALSITEQLREGKAKIKEKRPVRRFIAYFQAFTNTYAPVDYLEKVFTEAINDPDVCALSIATRPDCLPPAVLELLDRLNQIKPVWVELGLQTIHEESAARIQRGYSLPVFENAVRELKAAGLTVIVHVILGLPDETKAQMLDTVRYLADFQPAIDGIKLQLLHILRGTKLAELYEQAPFPVFSMDEYIELLIECIRLLPPDMVIHRISGDGPKKLLVAPEWSGNKRAFLNTFSKALRESGCFQGQDFTN